MHKRIIPAAASLAVALTLALSACGNSSAGTSSAGTGTSNGTKKTLTLATDANYPPCESYKKGTKTMIGFEPDLWNAMAAKLGIELKIVNTDFDSLIPGVQSGRYDLTMECISDNPEREKQVSFLDFIFAANSIITTEKYRGPISAADPLSICGQKMGSQTGFDSITTVKEAINPKCKAAGKDDVKISTFPSAAASYNALYSGRVDFIIQDTAAAQLLNESAPVKLNFLDNSLLPKYYLGIVFPKDDAKNMPAWKTALEALIADGTYGKILDTWGLSELKLTPGINLATSQPLKS